MLRIDGLVRRFPGGDGLGPVSLDLASGETLAVLGPSGAGKSTLLRLIAGLDTPDEGAISLRGRLVSRPSCVVPPWERRIGAVFQTPALWPHMTVADQIEHCMARVPTDAWTDRLAEVLAACRIAPIADRYPHQLSGGQARRAALARALATGSDLLLLDEPLAHLEPELREAIAGEISAIRARRPTTMVCVTHDRREAARLADVWIELEAGRVAAEGRFSP